MTSLFKFIGFLQRKLKHSDAGLTTYFCTEYQMLNFSEIKSFFREIFKITSLSITLQYDYENILHNWRKGTLGPVKIFVQFLSFEETAWFQNWQYR